MLNVIQNIHYRMTKNASFKDLFLVDCTGSECQ